MLRIHFDDDDLVRTRVAGGADPLWEITLSLHLLRNSQGDLVFDAWRQLVRSRLSAQLPMLRTLNPPRGYFPDFLTPSEGTDGLDTGIEAIKSTPRQRLGAELSTLAVGRDLPTWVERMSSGDSALLNQLESEVRTYERVAVAPYWTDIKSRVNLDRARRAKAVMHGGVEALLDSFHPVLRWRWPILEADYPCERDLRLRGRGLLLVPSFFCWRRPVTLADDDRMPVLVYPVEHVPGWLGRGGDAGVLRSTRSLENLLGPTRAAVLMSVRDDIDNGELARRVGVAASSASEHVAVLRDAGLVFSERVGRSVRHRLTSLGTALVAGEPTDG